MLNPVVSPQTSPSTHLIEAVGHVFGYDADEHQRRSVAYDSRSLHDDKREGNGHPYHTAQHRGGAEQGELTRVHPVV